MRQKLKIGIIGCGAIGTSLANAIVKEFRADSCVSALYDRDYQRAILLSKTLVKNDSLAVAHESKVIERAQFVIECAAAESAWKIAQKVIKAGRDIMLMSAGGIVSHYAQLNMLARRHNIKVYIPSGALAGVDGLKAMALGGIRQVTLTTFKNPVSFKGNVYVESKKMRLERITQDTTIFKGSAEEAVRFFPQNINVAAILSLAGIGSVKTQVKIVASPSLQRNVHEVEIVAEAGTMRARTENVVHPSNPKTSYLAVLSAIACLKQLFTPVRIGT